MKSYAILLLFRNTQNPKINVKFKKKWFATLTLQILIEEGECFSFRFTFLLLSLPEIGAYLLPLMAFLIIVFILIINLEFFVVIDIVPQMHNLYTIFH